MKSQIFILGMFAAFVIAREEKGAEPHTYDATKCFDTSLNAECNPGEESSYVRAQGTYFDKNHVEVMKCCKSKGDAHDEKGKKESEKNQEASVPNFVRRSGHKMKRRIIKN